MLGSVEKGWASGDWLWEDTGGGPSPFSGLSMGERRLGPNLEGKDISRARGTPCSNPHGKRSFRSSDSGWILAVHAALKLPAGAVLPSVQERTLLSTRHCSSANAKSSTGCLALSH